MKISEILNEEAKEELYFVKVVGNFYGGKYYETGIDSILVLAPSEQEAVSIAKDNIDAVEKHFRNKRYTNGKLAISKSDKRKFKPTDIKSAKVTKNTENKKVLKSDGSIGPVTV